MGDDQRQLGIVKFYNPRKGYGFVTRADGNDVFFHLTHLRGRGAVAPVPGNAVRFSLGQNREGLTAEDIVIVPSSEIECYEGTIVSLSPEGGVVRTADGFDVHFSRSDYIPHTRADTLRIGDEVEMHFVHEDQHGAWWAKVVRAADFDPDSAGRPERRDDGDDEAENRRLLGILYKTDLDDEALEAARLLCERNMRATLSALVSRVFDRRLDIATRRELVRLIGEIYFDDECQAFLSEMAARLAGALDEEDLESSPSAGRTLELLLDDEAFPVRWSQYLLPFGLSLLRNLSTVPSCHSLLQSPECGEAAERWLTRVCRHVEQRRSGYGYVMTTAVATFDELWQRDALHEQLDRLLSRLLLAVDGETLGNQIYHLRDKLSPRFLPVFLRLLSQHPELPGAVGAATQCEIVSQWIETILLGSEQVLPSDLLAVILPVVEEIRAQLVDDAAVTRLLEPLTQSLSPQEMLRLITEEDLPERSVWACLRHLDRRGELAGLLADPDSRQRLTAWLRRASEPTSAGLPRGQEVNTALHLLDSLRASEELRGELTQIGATLFSDVRQRFATADAGALRELLDHFDLRQLPGLTPVLARRLTDGSLDELTQRRVVAYFNEREPALGGLATALMVWSRRPDDAATTCELVRALEGAERSDDSEVTALAEEVRALLEERDVRWHDGFVVAIECGPSGQPTARIQGWSILLPERLFADPNDFAANRYVRLLYRRGIVLTVVRAPVPEGEAVVGRLAEPLAVDHRNAIVGTLVDLHGARCYFELAELRSGLDRPLVEGDLLRFTRVAAVDQADYEHIAFNVYATFGPAEVDLLLRTVVEATDELVARTALRVALEAGAEAERGSWRRYWEETSEARRTSVVEGLDAEAKRRLEELTAAR